jgi:hypothetical protein
MCLILGETGYQFPYLSISPPPREWFGVVRAKLPQSISFIIIVTVVSCHLTQSSRSPSGRENPVGPAWKAIVSKRFRPWRHFRTYLTSAYRGGSESPGRPFSDEPPLRAELFSTDQMAHHGVRLASAHHLTAQRMPDQLLSRLASNEGVPIDTCKRLRVAVDANHRITPAGEWRSAI